MAKLNEKQAKIQQKFEEESEKSKLKTKKLTADKKQNEESLKPLERQLRDYLNTKEVEEENI